ncbi:MAG: outer membrane protein assembly factor BamD [Flavobacteriaceae bacterium]
MTPAVTAFDNFIQDYPGSIYREDALFYKFDSATRLAINSFEHLKKDREQNARAAYSNLKKQFPNTKYEKDAQKLLAKLQREIYGRTKEAK